MVNSLLTEGSEEGRGLNKVIFCGCSLRGERTQSFSSIFLLPKTNQKKKIKVVDAVEYVMDKEPHSLKCQSSTEETHFRNKPLPILCYADAES